MNDKLISIGLDEYKEILRHAVAVIDETRVTIARQVNTSVASAYWELGKLLHERKLESKHGSGVVNQLSSDLKERYPKMGLSPRNLWDMKKFYERFESSSPKLRQLVAVLPWGHLLLLMQKVSNNDNAIVFYANEVITKGWNRDLLLNAIKMNVYENQSIMSR